jgi:tetratricopeptide (TPR) repeat protein
VHQDEQGGVALLPALRQVIYDELAVETREQYHLQAAAIRAERGEYTAAAYHLHRADQPEGAVELWYPLRRGEINRGQGPAALVIFAQISQRRLNKRQAQELALLRGELYELSGQPEKVVATLEKQEWSGDTERTIDAHILWGNALGQQGQGDAALRKYAEGLALQLTLFNQATQLHTLRGLTHLH